MRAHVLCALILSATGLLVTGCLDRDLKPLNPCTVSGVVEKIQVSNVEKVDMLFMIDNSNSMGEEQASLALELPNLMSVLASGDINGDGTPDFPPVKDLHVGVISSDMGTGGFSVPTCLEPNFGDDGVLRTEGNTSIPGCTATYPSFLEFRADSGADPTAFANDFRCVAQMGTGGCGFEQQLEAVLKAITPSTCTDPWCRFNMDTRGKADTENAGFIRPDSLLALVLLTDEEDCSAADPELFNPSSSVYSGNLNLRCFSYPTAVHPVERFVDGYLATRENPDLLVYAAITGVPPDLVSNPDAISYDSILGDERMMEAVDPTDPNRLAPSCNVPGRGLAFPPRRIVRVAQQIEAAGGNSIVQSICQANFSPALNAIIEKIANALKGACLPRDLVPNEHGKVGCDVVEVLAPDKHCSEVPGRELIRNEPDGREVCRVTQLAGDRTSGAPPSGDGWYYDDFTADTIDRCGADGQRISYTDRAEPITGTLVRLECLQPVQAIPGTDPGDITIGSSCTRDCAAAGYQCDATSNTCQKQCASDADCSAAGLAGWKCGGSEALAFCQNPTCG